MKALFTMQFTSFNLFPELVTFHSEKFIVTQKHDIYYEECGNPEGYPVVFFHGGPGSGCNPSQRRFFDPSFYRIILFDQRGCGKSTPLGCTEDNDTNALVSDIEKLKHHLGIKKWLVFGGSWGSTLALAYAIAHPDSVTGLILRGIFLSRQCELDWFLGEVRHFYPDCWEKLLSFIPENERSNPLQAYGTRVFSDDIEIAGPAATEWNAYESSIMSLLPRTSSAPTTTPVDIEVARARVQIHYILNECFVGHRDLIAEAKALSAIPTTIIQGRYDMVCPPISAWELKNAMPHAKFLMIADAGHSAMEAGITSALVEATEAFRISHQ
ncbi:MAG: prolyl aminopeptidase [Candidatus Methylopumilus sp.]|jgi:proline iminopeptidase|nr:prolyl aminopeptidase [Candidatus Methylopumilus sp.]